jgi:para-aminobenzoate synthetase component 1
VDPLEVVVCRDLPGSPAARDPFALLGDLSGDGHWMGWLSYEAGAWIEPAPHWPQPALPVLWAARHDPLLHIDQQGRQLWLEGHDRRRLTAVARVLEALPDTSPGVRGRPTPVPLEGWHWHTTASDFAAQVERIRAWIAAGDLFQANLTACCEQRLGGPADPLALYGRLRHHCPAPFAGVAIGAGDAGAVLSSSPERFLRLSAQGIVESRPIKGTRPRHGDPQADADAAAELITAPKDRAENVMIVDLLRNDLGRVCRPGSIHVPQLVGLESYRQVHHLTSVVGGQLREGLGVEALLRACWPGGSITGAPKVRACQRLHELEPVPRGPYCGSLFRLDGHGGFDSSILIRTLLLQGRLLRAHAGCGIVADSDPVGEAEEMGWKLQPLLEALA